jgi:hypothetical protein
MAREPPDRRVHPAGAACSDVAAFRYDGQLMAVARAPFAHTRHVPNVLGALAVRMPLLPLLVLALLCCAGSDDDEGAPGAAGTSGDACPNDLPDRAACEDGAPSYGREVAPIIDERCNACHYPGNAQTTAVWSDYDAVYARRRTIQSRIYSCVMPPQSAPQLPPRERAVLLEWLVCGAPEQ